MHLFDSHAHLTCVEMSSDIDEIIKRADAAGVKRIVNICTDRSSLETGLLLAEKYPQIQNTGATTPHDVEKEGELLFPLFEKAAIEKKLVAIGETGLDFHYEHSPIHLQKEFLVRYLELAASLKLPVIFHCREAFDDLFSIVDANYPKELNAVLHCFTGTVKEAEEVIKRGWFLSLSGIVTFKKSEELREVAKMVPLDQLLIETDAPFLAPQSKRGKQNEPAFILETAQKIAEAKGINVEDVAISSYNNAANLFKK